ncbi:MAG: hypothetical protein ACRDQ5_19450 [Sciscionella sp.]
MSNNVQFTYHFAIEQRSDVLVELSRSIHAAAPTGRTHEVRHSCPIYAGLLPNAWFAIAIDQQREFAETDHEQRSRLLANRTESRSGFVGGTR